MRKFVTMSMLALAGLAVQAGADVELREIARLDMRSFYGSTSGRGNNITAVAWNGVDAYAASYNTATGGPSSIMRVSGALANGTALNSTFGVLNNTTSAPRGYTGLDISQNTLMATWDQGFNNANSLQAFNLDATNTKRWDLGTAGSMGGTFRGFAGGAFNPGYAAGGGAGAGVSFSVQGSGTERLLNENTGGAAGTSGFLNGAINGVVATNGQTAYRDHDFDPATGDVYVRTNNNVTKGVRTGAGQYNSGSLLPILFDTATDGNNIVTNIQFLNTSAFGNLVLFNDRSSTANGQSYFTTNKIIDTNGVLQNVIWYAPDGSTFVPFSTGNAAYDYSFDAATQTLAVSDFNNNHIYIFAIPAPSAAALLGLGGLVAARRRRA